MKRTRIKGAAITLPISDFRKLENDIADLSRTIEIQKGVIEEWATRYHRLEGEYREVKGKWAAARETLFRRDQ